MFNVWSRALGSLGALTLNINSDQQALGEAPIYTLTGGQPNAQIQWSSFLNGKSTGEVLADYGHRLDATGNAALVGSPWQVANLGRWQKVATAAGEQASVSFDVIDPRATIVPTQTAQAVSTLGRTGIPLWAIIAAVGLLILTKGK